LERRGERLSGGRTGELKESIHIFHPVGVLGEGGFDKVVLAQKGALDGSGQLFAIKMLKKVHIINCCNVSFTTTEKQSLPHF
jgi:hypothetical protein